MKRFDSWLSRRQTEVGAALSKLTRRSTSRCWRGIIAPRQFRYSSDLHQTESTRQYRQRNRGVELPGSSIVFIPALTMLGKQRMAKDVFAHRRSQACSIVTGAAEMDAAEDTRVFDLIERLGEAGEMPNHPRHSV